MSEISALSWFDKKCSLHSRFFFSLFDILHLRPNQLFSEKVFKIKIFKEAINLSLIPFHMISSKLIVPMTLPWGVHTTK